MVKPVQAVVVALLCGAPPPLLQMFQIGSQSPDASRANHLHLHLKHVSQLQWLQFRRQASSFRTFRSTAWRMQKTSLIPTRTITHNGGGDLDDAVLSLTRAEGSVDFLNARLPLHVNQHEISKEIWLSTPEERRDEWLEKWADRMGVPVRVATLCAGTDAPVHGMRNQTLIWNEELDNTISCFYHHILSCDIKATSRRFIYANSPCPLLFHRTPGPTAYQS